MPSSGMTFPHLSRNSARVPRALQDHLGVEEKRKLPWLQLRDVLINLPRRPQIVGKQAPKASDCCAPMGARPEDIVKALLPRCMADPWRPASRCLEQIERR